MASLAHPPTPTVSTWVARFAAAIKASGAALDLACGSGRHARYLAELGLQVEAVDRDAAALAQLEGVPRVTTRCADLEAGAWPYAGCTFDAIVVTNYLHRPLFPLLAAALAPGGVLIYETFRLGNESYGSLRIRIFCCGPANCLNLPRRLGSRCWPLRTVSSLCPNRQWCSDCVR